jgi:hypothetical protein
MTLNRFTQGKGREPAVSGVHELKLNGEEVVGERKHRSIVRFAWGMKVPCHIPIS